MTSTEATQKFCPFKIGTIDTTGNDNYYCCGDECMAWCNVHSEEINGHTVLHGKCGMVVHHAHITNDDGRS
jgi:hypothetical protein